MLVHKKISYGLYKNKSQKSILSPPPRNFYYRWKRGMNNNSSLPKILFKLRRRLFIKMFLYHKVVYTVQVYTTVYLTILEWTLFNRQLQST